MSERIERKNKRETIAECSFIESNNTKGKRKVDNVILPIIRA